MTFLFGSVVNLFNNFRTKFWPKEDLKRRRDSIEDEDDDSYLGCEGMSKRPKWMTSATYPSQHNMAASGNKQSSKTWSTVLSKSSQPNALGSRSFPSRLNGTEQKKNQEDVIEVIDVVLDETKLESRAPLSDLKVLARGKPELNSNGGAISRNSNRNHTHERKQNGLHSDIFHSFTNGSLRLSKSCSVPKLTAVCESFQMDDRHTYSQLLEDYLKTNCREQKSIAKDNTSQDWTLVSSVRRKSKCQGKTSPECIDLTNETKATPKSNRPLNVKPWCSSNLFQADTSERIQVFCERSGRHKNNASLDLTEENKEVKQYARSRLNMKPRSPPVVEQDLDSIEFLCDRPIKRVNSLEKLLAQNSVVNPQWISDIQKRYNEKEREVQRQLEETRIKKDLYSKHNHKKLTDALEDRILRHLSLTDVVLDETEDDPPLPELTEEMMAKIKFAMKPGPPSQIIVEGFNLQIKRMDLRTLDKLNWLNDEVINFYMCLLIERGEQEKYMPVYAFNTFFYPKLIGSGYSSLRRWTKKVDIFSHQMVFVPIHLGMHWCMATIDFRDKTIRYYDSMGSGNNRCLIALKQYLEEESLDKKKTPYDTSDWKLENVKNIPQQMNGSDCGMFSCMFAEYLSRNAKLTFSQNDMPYFRLKMVYEIISKQLLM